jgi:hypothetical protein
MRRTHLFIALVTTGLNGINGARLAMATGHGARSGAHDDLKIIGVPHDQTVAMNDTNGRRLTNQKGSLT